ncbi:hypothetical protein [Krasilnikovia sp. MM14-A1259]|uniref:hypothetical protein n=1 Tax=Krasilnikovia sp. MM14-A1259 TaxID=3373539 RepID=UPI00399CEF60
MGLSAPASAAAGADVAVPAFLVGTLDKPHAVAAKDLRADCSGVEAPKAGFKTWKFDTAVDGKFKVFTAVFVGAKKKLAVGRWAALDPQHPQKYTALGNLGDLAKKPEFKDIAKHLANGDTQLADLAKHRGLKALPKLGLHGAMTADFGSDREAAALTLPAGWKLRAASTVIEPEGAAPEDVAENTATTLEVTGVCRSQRHHRAKHHNKKHHNKKKHHAKKHPAKRHHAKNHHKKHHAKNHHTNQHPAKHHPGKNHHGKRHHAKNHHAKKHHA